MELGPDTGMVLTFLVIGISVVLYATERYPIEGISLGVLGALMLLFPVLGLPVRGDDLNAAQILEGFSNTGLITILALLVVGQGLFHTNALERPANAVVGLVKARGRTAIALVFLTIGAISAFINNTPAVVMFLPIMSALAAGMRMSTSRLMMPLSFITILGGMTTLIGSSTNLLVANIARQEGAVDLGFFSFTPIALMLAGIGALYVIGVMPFALGTRKSMADEIRTGTGRQFIAEIAVKPGHPLVGQTAVAGLFPQLSDMTVRLVQRGEKPFLPPFENLTLQVGDVMIVAATRQALQKAIMEGEPVRAEKARAEKARAEKGRSGGAAAANATAKALTATTLPPGIVTLAEAIVAPGSRLIGRTIAQAGLRTETGCVVLGIQRRSRMPRLPMTEIRLEPGDVLLFAGPRAAIDKLRDNHDVLLVDWTAADMPAKGRAPLALAIFVGVVAAAASHAMPIVAASLLGALAMIVTGCLNVRQATRVIDGRIVMLIAASIASANALTATGGAQAIAETILSAVDHRSTPMILSAFFLLVATTTNFLTNNAAAVLYTPIALGLATSLDLPAEPFVVTVILAANCSFATPVAYQTNLLVMGPGHYRYADFVLAGTPLVLLLWGVFSFLAPWYYGL